MSDTRRFDITQEIEETVARLLDTQETCVIWTGYVCERRADKVIVRRFRTIIVPEDGSVLTSDAIKDAIRIAVTEAADE